MILSIDPGGTTGVALWTCTGRLLENYKCGYEDAMRVIARADPELTDVVYEDFRLLQGKAVRQSGSRFEAVQVIGCIKTMAILRPNISIHRQNPQILRVAALHSNTDVPLNSHIDDAVSAYLHGYYYFESVGILRPLSTAARV